MTNQAHIYRETRFLIIAAAFVIIIYGIYQAQSVVALLLVSVFLALLGTPAVLWLERKRVPSSLAVMIVMIAMIILVLGVVAVVGTSLSTFQHHPHLADRNIHSS